MFIIPPGRVYYPACLTSEPEWGLWRCEKVVHTPPAILRAAAEMGRSSEKVQHLENNPFLANLEKDLHGPGIKLMIFISIPRPEINSQA